MQIQHTSCSFQTCCHKLFKILSLLMSHIVFLIVKGWNSLSRLSSMEKTSTPADTRLDWVLSWKRSCRSAKDTEDERPSPHNPPASHTSTRWLTTLSGMLMVFASLWESSDSDLIWSGLLREIFAGSANLFNEGYVFTVDHLQQTKIHK